MKPFIGRLLITLLLLVALTVLGTLGYAAIEGATLWDSLYMAAITLTAVGYDEVIPLSQSGRLFTMGLLIGGFAWMGLRFALITSFIVELDLRQVFCKRQIVKSIEEMSEHIVICGAGRSGRQIAEELSAMGRPFVVIEQDPSQVEAFGESDPAGKDEEAGFLYNPSGDTTLEPGDEVIALGRTDQMEDLRSYLS